MTRTNVFGVKKMEVREGTSPRLENNNWFNESIKPKVVKALYIDYPDNFHYQIVKTEDDKILVLKVTHTGYIKSTMNMRKDLAKELGKILVELSE